MSELMSLLHDLIDLTKIVAPVLTILVVISLLWVRITRRPSYKSPKPVAAGLLASLCALAYAIGAGSCVLGGFIQGSDICSLQGRGQTPLDAVKDFFEIQAVYLAMFLLTLLIAWIFALSLPPGNATVWQRSLFLTTGGRLGAWRERHRLTTNRPLGAADKALEKVVKAIDRIAGSAHRAEMPAAVAKERERDEQANRLLEEMNDSVAQMESLYRGVKLFAWLIAITFPLLSLGLSVPFIMGAFTHETFSFGRARTMVGLETEPLLFWSNMALSAVLSAVTGLGAFHAIRALRSDKSRTKPTVGCAE
jgi:hypothetical protein